jgi:hypothetical protein
VRRHAEIPLAVDPGVVPVLSAHTVDSAKINPVSTEMGLQALLRPFPLALQDTEIVPGKRVLLLTTAEEWTYLQAANLIRQGNLKQAYAVLLKAEADKTGFDGRCRDLKDAVLHVAAINRLAGKLSQEVDGALRGLKKAEHAVTTTRVSSAGGLGGSGRRSPAAGPSPEAERAAQAGLTAAGADAKVALAAFANGLDDIESEARALASRFNAAHADGLLAEAVFLLSTLVRVHEALEQTADNAAGEGLRLEVDVLGELPEPISLFLKTRTELLAEATQLARNGVQLLDQDIERAGSMLDRAVFLDRSDLVARSAAGYCLPRRHAASAARCFVVSPPAEQTAAALRTAFEEQARPGYAAAVARAMGHERPVPGARMQESPGRTYGSTRSRVFPIGVTLARQSRSVMTDRTPARASWQDLDVYRYRTPAEQVPVSFADYFRQDPRMRLAAVEAYRWLNWRYKAQLEGRSLQVGMHGLESAKEGDLASLPIALGAISRVEERAARLDVMALGNLRGDGAVHAAAPAADLLVALPDAKAVEIVLVPRDCAPDLARMTPEEVCRSVVVLVDNLNTAEHWLFDPDYKRDAVAMLQELQMRVLLGQSLRAREPLEQVARENPEFYTARRLLELMALAR